MPDRQAIRRALEFAVTAALLTAAAIDFVLVDRTSHSASDTLLAWVPRASLLLLIGWAVVAASRRIPTRRE